MRPRFNFWLILLLVSIYFFNGSVYSQSQKFRMRKQDSIRISQMERLELSTDHKLKTTLPYSIDNSTLPFFRPIFEQYAYSCGQSSSIGYIFTYEINRIRNLSSHIEQNQYPPDFTWNILNEGGLYVGVPIFESWDIAKHFGQPSVKAFGGMAQDLQNHTLWMSGYEKYYEAMHNRIKDFYAIDVSTPEGLLTLKHWLTHHLDDSEYGGVANILISSGGEVSEILEDGTEGAGSEIIISWGEYVGHQITIVGYNDSIRFDLNQDGRYTNNVDINADGLIDLKDWEIGAYKVANSYMHNTFWPSGFKYMMYCIGAEEGWDGGLWGKSAYVIDAKENVDPSLCMKVKLEHNSRNKIKVTAGVSSNINSEIPEHIIDFTIFNYQGGDNYMQGGNSAADKIIEFGLDLTPLLEFIEEDSMVKFFLLVNEKDPVSEANGKVHDFSIIDYNNDETEYFCQQEDVTIQNNGLTQLDITLSPLFDKLEIAETEIVNLNIYEDISYQLFPTGGNLPYQWDIIESYNSSPFNENFPDNNGEELDITWGQFDFNQYYGMYATQELGFKFPFYGNEYDKVYLHKTGLITFDKEIYEWPYSINTLLLLKNSLCIAPLSLDLNIISSSRGIYYDGNNEEAIFWWDAGIEQLNNDTDVNFAVKLTSNKEIYFYYGDNYFDEDIQWVSGISCGDGKNYELRETSDQETILMNTGKTYVPETRLNGLEISDNGTIHGELYNYVDSAYLNIKLIDNNLVETSKAIPVSAKGVEILNNYGNADGIFEFGEIVNIGTQITNYTGAYLSNTVLKLRSASPYITIIDSVYEIGDFGMGESVYLNDNFQFQLSYDIPNDYEFSIETILASNSYSNSKKENFNSSSPVVKLTNTYIKSISDNALFAGELAMMHMSIFNIGSTINDISIQLISLDPNISIIDSLPISFDSIVNSLNKLQFNIQLSDDIAFNHLYPLKLKLSALEGNYNKDLYFNININRSFVLIIDLAPQYLSGELLMNSFDNFEIEYVYTHKIDSTINNYHTVFLLAGIHQYEISWNSFNWNLFQNYLNQGGHLYSEGMLLWTKTNPTTMLEQCSMYGEQLLPYLFIDTLYGQNGGFWNDYEYIYSPDYYPAYNVSNFEFRVNEPSEILFQDKLTGTGAVAAYQTDSTKAIFSTVILNGFKPIEGRKSVSELIYSYCDFFNLFPPEDNSINEYADESMEYNIYPNPFSNNLNIDLILKEGSSVEFTLYDLNGRKIKSLINRDVSNGFHQISLNLNETSDQLYNGIYFYTLRVGNSTYHDKLIYLK